MDIANAIMTFLPAAAIASSIIVRVVKHHAESSARRGSRRALAVRRRPALPISLMFRSSAPSPHSARNNAERRSYAAERPTEPLGTGIGNSVPALAEQVGTLSDDALLRELALVLAADGTPKYAESRIAKFIGGRVEDRIAQVRAVRGVPAPPKIAPINRQYPQRSPEQELLRQQLGIGKRATR